MKSFLNRYSSISVIILLMITNLAVAQDGNLSIESSENIKNIISKKKEYNKNIKKVAGYRIQIFFGSEQGSYKTRDEFKTLFPETYLKIENFPPDWKVRVGNYKTRLEADRALVEIKEAYTGAVVLAELIDVVRDGSLKAEDGKQK